MKSVVIACAAWLCLAAPAAHAQATAGSRANVATAGASVELAQPVAGDLIAAAGRIRVVQPVAQDAALAAGEVAVQARIGQDLRAAGGRVAVSAPVGGEAHLVGVSVRLERGADVAGPAWLAGGEVQLLGRVGGGAKVFAGTLVVEGTVQGDLQVTAENVEIRPGAQLGGALRYASRNPLRMAEGARVAGPIERQALPDEAAHAGGAGGAVGLAFWLVTLFAAGVVWVLVFPRFSDAARAQLQRAPAASLGVGFLVLVAMPMAVLLLAITIVGLPLAGVLVAAYGLVLLAGYLVVATTLADRLLGAAGQAGAAGQMPRLAALAAALLLLVLVSAIPVVGWLIALGALMAGSGALVRQRFAHAA
jgi:hypothetical protein